ncbi:hypothetical protein MASR2M79_00730 [Aminivibrio sp.]
MAFPFVAEQKFVLRLPPKTDVVALPDGMKRELEKVRYEERRSTTTSGNTNGGIKIVLSADEITGIRPLRRASAGSAYSARTLPLRILADKESGGCTMGNASETLRRGRRGPPGDRRGEGNLSVRPAGSGI